MPIIPYRGGPTRHSSNVCNSRIADVEAVKIGSLRKWTVRTLAKAENRAQTQQYAPMIQIGGHAIIYATCGSTTKLVVPAINFSMVAVKEIPTSSKHSNYVRKHAKCQD
ncbi:hypothetical protein COOONC_17768 [Cooperia oncophora]